MKVTLNGGSFTLEGKQVKVGDMAPDFVLINNSLEPVSLKDMTGKKVFVVVPSLDTPVCDLEVQKFNKKSVDLNATVYAISSDLPFAQARWCGATSSDKVISLSDYNSRSFGHNYGTFIKELAIQTRAVIILDENNKVIYSEYLEEITNEPNYEAAYASLV
ncbi:MAG: thiol peroxidase [Oscillospiraceae bacterium]